MNGKSVFISYSNQNKEIAEEVYDYLEGNGITCWMASHSITPGANYPAAIAEGIRNCSAFVLIASKATNRSNHVESELGMAFDFDKPIVAFRIEDEQFADGLLYYVGRKQWIEAHVGFEHGLDELKASLLDFLQAGEGRAQTAPSAPLREAPAHRDPPRRTAVSSESKSYRGLSREEIAELTIRSSYKYAYSLTERLSDEAEYRAFCEQAEILFADIITGYCRNSELPSDTDYVELLCRELKKEGAVVRVQGLPGTAKNMLLQLAYLRLMREFANGESNVLPVYLSVGYFEKYDYAGENLDAEVEALIREELAPCLTYLSEHPEVRPAVLLEAVREYTFSRVVPEKQLFEIFKPYGKYPRAVTIDVGLVQTRSRLKKVIPIAGTPGDGYLLSFAGVPIEDEERVKRMIRAVGKMYGDDTSADEIYGTLRRLKYVTVDVFLIRFVSREMRASYDSRISVSEMYERFVLNELQDEDRLLEVSKRIYEYVFLGGAGHDMRGYDNRLWAFPNKHNTYLGYFIAYYFVHCISNYKSLEDYEFFKFMLTSTANQFVVSMLQDDYDLQKTFVEFVDSKYEIFDMRQKCNAAYWLGRINASKALVNFAVSFLTGQFAKLKTLVKADNKNTQENLDRHLVFRAVCTGMLFHGQANMMDEYLCVVITNDIANAVNRGSTVEYFGEGYQMGAHNTYCLDTDPNLGERAIKALCARVEASLNFTRDKFVENNLVTLLTLLQARIQNESRKPKYDVDRYVRRALEYLRVYKQKPQNIVSAKILYYFASVEEDFGKYLREGSLDIGPHVYNRFRRLKYVKRSQWAKRVEDPESMIEHMYGAWLLAMIFLPEETGTDGYNKKEILDMLLIHDMTQAMNVEEDAERPAENIEPNVQNDFMRKFFLKGTYPNIANLTHYYNVWTGYYNGNNVNAKIAHDVNTIQTIYTFCEYGSAGKCQCTDEEIESWLRQKDGLTTAVGFDLFARLIENNYAFRELLGRVKKS